MKPLTSAGCLMVAAALACPDPLRASEIPPGRPFETLLPWTLERGRCDAAGGIMYRDGSFPPFFSDRRETRRDEWRLSIVDISCGLGSGGEARLEFGLQRFSEQGGVEKTGIQDARISFTYQLPVRRIGAALHLGVKLPNASNEERLGTDQADIFLIGAVGREGGRWGWASDLGLAILGSPSDAGVQDDLVVAGAAVWVAAGADGPDSRVTLLGEVHGMAASRFGNDVRFARAGLRLGRRIPVDLSLRRGLTSESGRWGAEAGLTIPIGG